MVWQDEFDFPDATVPELHIAMKIRQPDNLPFNPYFERDDFVQQMWKQSVEKIKGCNVG